MKLLAFLVLCVPAAAAAQGLQRSGPRFQPGQCYDVVAAWGHEGKVECGHVAVPVLRERPERSTIRLAVVILRARLPSGAPPIVYLHGGPGANGITSRFPFNAVRWQLARNRDVVVYDQRGAGLSEPKLCPEVVERSRWFDAADAATAGACIESMKASGIEPSGFTTAANAADAIDVRRALGYTSWDIYGVSYGSRLALELMRRDPSGIRAVALSGPLPPGPRVRAEHPLSFQRALERVFKACAAQPACTAAFPTVERDFYALYDALTANPIEVTPQNGGSTGAIRLDGWRFVEELQKQLASARLVPRIPLLIHDLLRGDRMKAARTLVSGDIGRLNPTLMLVSTYDVCGPQLREEWQSVRRQLAPPFAPEHDLFGACGLWQERFADASTYVTVRSDIPTLILTSEFDDRTPPAYGRLLATTLKRSFVYEFPGLVHAVEITSPCYESILLTFLKNPQREPDSSCIAAAAAMTFETGSLDRRRFVLHISGPDKAHSTLGTWEAVLPGPQSTVRFDLTIDGAMLTGTIIPSAAGPTPSAPPVPIFDGRIEGVTIRFKAISPDGARTITFSGTLSGDELDFTREVAVPPGAPRGREGVFGALGPNAFAAQRVK